MGRPKVTRDSLIALATARAIERVTDGSKPGVKDWVRASKLAAEAVSLPVSIAIAYEDGAGADGGWPTQVEYAHWWKISERSAQREWATFKAVFGREADPYELAQLILANYGARLREQDVSVAYDVPSELAGHLLAV